MTCKVVTLRFSIIVPVYNVEKYLGECLESIHRQDFDDYEVVIVDDGSMDGCMEIYERFAANSAVPVCIVKQENKGLLGARRAGIKVARGDYLWHVDGDDGLAPHALRSVSDAIDKTNADLLIVGATDTPKFNSALPGMIPGEQCLFTASEMNIVRISFLAGYIPSIWMKIARRSCVDVSRDYMEYGKLQLGEDQLQSLHVLDAAASCFIMREPLYYYRPNDGSITSRYREGQIADYLLVKEALYSQAKLWDKKWPGYGFVETMLVGYLSNGFYDMRKSADNRYFRRQFQEFSETNLYSKAIEYRKLLRTEQKIFYLLLEKKMYALAFACLLVCRAATPLIRGVKR